MTNTIEYVTNLDVFTPTNFYTTNVVVYGWTVEPPKPSKSFMNEAPSRTEFIIVLFLLSFALSMIYSAVTRKS